jgi:hypothetical protein
LKKNKMDSNTLAKVEIIDALGKILKSSRDEE